VLDIQLLPRSTDLGLIVRSERSVSLVESGVAGISSVAEEKTKRGEHRLGEMTLMS
jgi:hypothetical protein